MSCSRRYGHNGAQGRPSTVGLTSSACSGSVGDRQVTVRCSIKRGKKNKAWKQEGVELP